MDATKVFVVVVQRSVHHKHTNTSKTLGRARTHTHPPLSPYRQTLHARVPRSALLQLLLQLLVDKRRVRFASDYALVSTRGGVRVLRDRRIVVNEKKI